MLARVREEGGGYKVTLFSAEGEVESRVTLDLAEAFRWQAVGAFPEPVAQPAVKKGKRK